MNIYQKFCAETFDANGCLTGFSLKYPDNFNFGYDVVDAIAEAEPERRALVWCNAEGKERIFTFEEIRRLSNRAANVFESAGICRGDRVMVMLKRHFEYWICSIALHKLGAVMIPATHMLTVDDLCYRIQNANVRGVVSTCQDDVPEKIMRAIEALGHRALLWTVQQDVQGFRNLTREMDDASEVYERRPTCAADPMVIYFTSGTTDYPKGVIHDFSYPLAHIITARYWHGAKDGGLHFTVAETGWAKASWGKIYGQWLTGCAVMVYDFDSFDPRQLVSVINRYGVTSFCAPPTVYRYLVRREIPPMPTLERATTAGEMLAPEVFRKFTEQTGLLLYEGYGQTETALMMANFVGSKPEAGSIGIPSALYQIEIRKKDGSPAKRGDVGEICIVPDRNGRIPGVFIGYLNNDSQYERVWQDGVYHTGDAARLDENGRCWFHGRFDDIIKTGGFRIGPYEVENVLMEHPAVLECSVIGVPDPLRGQSIKAIIQLNQGFEASRGLEKDIKDFSNARLAEYKRIRSFEFVSEMPKTISGKIRKKIQRMQNG